MSSGCSHPADLASSAWAMAVGNQAVLQLKAYASRQSSADSRPRRHLRGSLQALLK